MPVNFINLNCSKNIQNYLYDVLNYFFVKDAHNGPSSIVFFSSGFFR